MPHNVSLCHYVWNASKRMNDCIRSACTTKTCILCIANRQKSIHAFPPCSPCSVSSVLVTDVNQSFWTNEPLWATDYYEEGQGLLSWALPVWLRKWVRTLLCILLLLAAPELDGGCHLCHHTDVRFTAQQPFRVSAIKAEGILHHGYWMLGSEDRDPHPSEK